MTQHYARTFTLNQKRMALEQTYLLCVEPSSKQLFQINLGTQTAEEVVLEQGQEITNKIKREEYKMDQLLDRQDHYQKWFFQNETAQSFRRQMVPFYLLEKEANLYPVYVDNSNIDENLTSDFKIHEIEVKMSDSIWETIHNNMAPGNALATGKFTMEKGSIRPGTTVIKSASKKHQLISEEPPIHQMSNVHLGGLERPTTADPLPFTKATAHADFKSFTLKDVSLLTTADKVIKKCEKEIEQLLKSRFNFRETQNKMQILKFKSVDSYAYSDTQLIYFVEIREYLRARAKDTRKPLELVLISLSDDMMANNVQNIAPGLARQNTTRKVVEQQSQQFPPLIEQKLNHPTQQHSQNQRIGTISNVEKRSFRANSMVGGSFIKPHKTFKKQTAEKFKKVSIFGWYTPFKFNKKRSDEEKPGIDTRASTAQSMFSISPLSEHNSPELASASYSKGEKFQVTPHKQQHGHVPLLHEPNKGLIPYTADSEILKSCDVKFPLRIRLLALRELAERLRNEAFGKKKESALDLRIISYMAPQESQNQDVMNLLAQCQAVSSNQSDQGLLRKNLINAFGNQGLNKNFSQGFQQMQFKVQKTKLKQFKQRSEKIFTMKPQYIQVQAALYLGCRRISTFSYSKPQLYSNEMDFSGDFLEFYKPLAKMRLVKQKELDEEMITPEISGEVLKISCLPSCARLCFNVILLPEPGSCSVIKADKQIIVEEESGKTAPDKMMSFPANSQEGSNLFSSKATITQKFVQREGFVLGSCQVSLFDETFLIRQGKRECRLWPFESFQPRMVCQGECYEKNVNTAVYKPYAISQCMTMQIEFQSFAGKVGWRLQKDEVRKSDRFHSNNYLGRNQAEFNNQFGGLQTNDLKSQKTAFENVDLERETKSLKQVKRLLDAYPMDLDEEAEEDLQVDKVLEYRNYIHKMPIFIRLIDFTDHEKIGICYDTLDGSGLAKDMLPEESLALLDGQFGDIKVRIFAVKKLSMLNDSQIALFMPQLIQALKYELFHHSPLAEFLLEKALKNTRVVGHAFYWSLKANLHWPHSRERFCLILERFLMCCGQFKNDFLKQVLVNRSMMNVSDKVNEKLDVEKASKTYALQFMHRMLKEEEIRIKLTQQLIIAHAKYDDHVFKANGQLYDPHASSATEMDVESESKIRRMSGKGSSGGEDEKRRQSNKFIRSDGSSQPESYEFNEKTINDFIDTQLSAILSKINFPIDEEDKEEDMNDPRRQQYRLSPRSQAADPSLNNLHYNRWKVDWQSELLYIPFAPKNPFSSFTDKDGKIFMSKKKPLLILCNLANEQETEAALSAQNNQAIDYKNHEPFQQVGGTLNRINDLEGQRTQVTDNEEGAPVLKQFLFKKGDDLRQDNLVLQFFKIMDRLWQSSGDDLQMMCYDVMETGFETGYIEFIDNATVITQMHTEESFLRGPFREKSILNFFLKKVGTTREFTVANNPQQIQDKLNHYNDTYLKSLAGQCVATYVLGIRDRHPGNFMLHNMTGTFFHIDFGHFLGHGKKKLGFQRDREPFILSNELHYLLKYFCLIDVREKTDDKSNKVEQQASQQPSRRGNKRDSVMMLDDIPLDFQQSGGDPRTNKDLMQEQKVYELFFNADMMQERGGDKRALLKRSKRITPDYFEELFEKLASQAFLKIRQNADIFINLLILMLVAGLDELDQPSIGFVKRALYLDVSEEEATVQFKQTIDQARKQWYRPIDNLFHVFNDNKKAKRQSKREEKANKKRSMSKNKRK